MILLYQINQSIINIILLYRLKKSGLGPLDLRLYQFVPIIKPFIPFGYK